MRLTPTYGKMTGSSLSPVNLEGQGLKSIELASLEEKFGKNEFAKDRRPAFLRTAWDIVREPMFLILLLACVLYFVLGETVQGLMMIVALFLVAAISFYQEVKSANALSALKQFTQPMVEVIRDSREQFIPSRDLLPGDLVILEEGDFVPADAIILKANDLSVNESILTGESIPADKAEDADNRIYQGTTINSGRCHASVTTIGSNTQLGKLGKSLEQITTSKTELQRQINRFVRIMAAAGITLFFIIWIVNFLYSGRLIQSLLFGLTFAMAIIPEEIPVAFSSFMALGAYRMAKMGIITRQPLTIENLGAVSVICLDKTGTITENRMSVKQLYAFEQDSLLEFPGPVNREDLEVLWYGRLASEKVPFDAMEKAIVEAYEQRLMQLGIEVPAAAEIEHEYPLSGKPPMMTHVYDGVISGEEGSPKVVAGKGAPERILEVCRLSPQHAEHVRSIIQALAAKGYRILGVCGARLEQAQFPIDQNGFDWQFKGLVALYDPPRPEVAEQFGIWRKAGIAIKLVTGDFLETSRNIAAQVGLDSKASAMTGEQVMEQSDDELKWSAKPTTLFARMFPESKLRLTDALKNQGEIVAMMGDGVNDGPALRSADIGIAMGQKGTEIARRAADLILTDDDLAKVTQAIRHGRKIYDNLKKAIRYILSIHLPIMVVASVPLLLNWTYPHIFTPIHIIFLELIMGPTCSIFFENEPAEPGVMEKPPRGHSEGFFTRKELAVSLLLGAGIAAGIMSLYYYFMQHAYSLSYVRTVVFLTMIMGNIFLTFTNRSFDQNIFQTFRYRNFLARYIVAISVIFLGLLAFVPVFRDFFGMTSLSAWHYVLCFGVAAVYTLWFEVFKTYVRP